MNTIPSSLSKEEIENKLEKLYKAADDKEQRGGFHHLYYQGKADAYHDSILLFKEYAAQQLQPPGTSDAVEFLKFYLHDDRFNFDFYDPESILIDDNTRISFDELYNLFLKREESEVMGQAKNDDGKPVASHSSGVGNSIEQESVSEKLHKLSSGYSSWRVNAKYHVENSGWLKMSSQIARRVLAAFEDGGEQMKDNVAMQIGVSKEQMDSICKGHQNLTLRDIYNLSQALKVDLIQFPDYKYSRPIVLNSEQNPEGSDTTGSASR